MTEHEHRDGDAVNPEPQADERTQQLPADEDVGRHGTIRFQDPATATPRPPTLAEQRARQRAEQAEEEREQAEAQAAARRRKRRRLLIGGGVGVGVVALVAAAYAATPEVSARCVDSSGTVVADDECDDAYVTSHGGYSSGGLYYLSGGQYRYYYGGTGGIGQHVSGGSYSKPSFATVRTSSGRTIQRGGFGVSGKSSGGSSGGSKSGGS